MGGREAGGRAIRGDRRADTAAADLCLRLSAVGTAAGPTTPQGPTTHRGLGSHHRWHRTRNGFLGAYRSGDPARSAHGAVPQGRRWAASVLVSIVSSCCSPVLVSVRLFCSPC